MTDMRAVFVLVHRIYDEILEVIAVYEDENEANIEAERLIDLRSPDAYGEPDTTTYEALPRRLR